MPSVDIAARALHEVHARTLGAYESAGTLARTHAEERKRRIAADHERAAAIARNRSAQSVIEHSLIARDAHDLRPALDDPLSVAEHVALGTLHTPGTRSGVNADIRVPLVVPLVGRANLVVRGDGSSDIVRESVWRALDGTAAGQLALTGFDPRLTGTLAPFAPLRDHDLFTVHSLATEFDAILEEVAAEIQRVNDTLRGETRSLVEYRSRLGFPFGQFRLIVLLSYPSGIDEATHRRIMAVANAAPASGVSFIVQIGDDLPEWFTVAEVEGLGNSIVDRHGSVTWTRHPSFTATATRTDATALTRDVDAFTIRVARATAPALPFGSIEPATPNWTASSRDGLAFVVGRSGPHPTEIVLGDEREQRHNVLVTGAVGQGKSNLLKVLIHSLAQRYSPDELEMYLLDFKEGVTLYPLAPTPGAPDYLPHARVLGLESDRDFGIAVLRHLERELTQRAKLFRPYGEDIAKYRSAVPDARMPRIVVVVDEFQLLFDPADSAAEEAAQLLETLARKGRSYGVHIVLASQTVSGITALLARENGIFAQFPIRLALKNTVAESFATLAQGNDAAARLRTRGEAVLNVDYGFEAANRQTVIAVAEEPDLAARRASWHSLAKDRMPPPVVFDGSRRVRAGDVIPALRRLRQRAAAGTAPPSAVVGMPIAVETEPLIIGFAAGQGRHLAIVGAGEATGEEGPVHTAIGVLQTAAISLALQHPLGDARFVMLDALDARTAARNNQAAWLDVMASFGFPVEVVPRADIGVWLRALADEISEDTTGPDSRYVLGFGLERADLDQPDLFAHRPSEDLQTLLRTGGSRSVHLLGWWASAAAYSSNIGFDGAGYVEATLLLRLDQAATHDLLGPFVTWSVRDNRGLLTDRTQLPEPVTTIPFSPLESRDAAALSRTDWS